MNNINVNETKEYPYTIMVKVKKTCTICKDKFEWNDFWFQRNGGQHNNGYGANNGVCKNCAFWTEHVINDTHNEDAIVIDNYHWIIGSKLQDYKVNENDSLEDIAKKYNSNSSVKGMGGAKCIIRKSNGEVVITDDLWGQGDIPKWFSQPNQDDLDIPAFIRKSAMKNNAVMIGAI